MLCTCLLWAFAIQPAAAMEFPTIGKIQDYEKKPSFSPDNRTIVTTSKGTVNILSADTGSSILTIPTTLAQIFAKFSEDGTKLYVTGIQDGTNVTTDIYDTKTGQLLRKLFTFTPEKYYRYDLNYALMNKHETISYISVNEYLYFIDHATGAVIDKVSYPSYPQSLTYNAANNELIVVLRNQINVLNGNTAQFLQTVPLSLGNNQIVDATFDQEGTTLYVSVLRTPLLAFNAKANYQSMPFLRNEFPNSQTTSSNSLLSVSANNHYLIISPVQSRTNIYERATGKLVVAINNSSWWGLAISDNLQRLLIGTSLLDSTDLIPKEITQLQIEHPVNVLIGQVASVDVYGLTTTNERVLLDASTIEWTINNPSILAPYYGKLSGESVGTTTVTAHYNGLSSTFSIAVVPPFIDVSASHPNYEAINRMREIGIINGYEDNTYRPNDPIPRHHIAAMVGRSGIELPTTRGTKSFLDIPTTHANYAHIQKLYRAGIIDGDGNYFKPLNNITHIQLAKILTNLFDFKKANSTTYRFSDVANTNWGYPYAEIMVSNRIMPMTSGKFNAQSPVTRSQFAQYLYNALTATK